MVISRARCKLRGDAIAKEIILMMVDFWFGFHILNGILSRSGGSDMRNGYMCDCERMGLLPDTHNYGCACAGNAGNVFLVTADKRSRHASRHVRDARAVMHAGIAN